MRNELSGRVTGTSFQIGDVHGDIVLIGNSTPATTRPRVRPQPSGSDTKLIIGYVVLGVISIIIFSTVTKGCDSHPADTGFPASDRGTRPAGVSNDMVAEVMSKKFQSCEAEAVVAPPNCPQAHNTAGAENVKWHAVGDPIDGMLVRWDRDRFVVLGAAVMTIDYDKGIDQYSEDEKFYFEAEVRWRGAATRIDAIHQPKSDPPTGTIRKERFDLPDDDLVEAVRHGFAVCASATSAPMPRRCPRRSVPRARNVTWSLEGNPLANWRSSRDPEFGLLRVTASYSLVAHWLDTGLWWNTNESRTQSGTYEAVLVRTADGKARLLTIKHVP